LAVSNILSYPRSPIMVLQLPATCISDIGGVSAECVGFITVLNVIGWTGDLADKVNPSSRILDPEKLQPSDGERRRKAVNAHRDSWTDGGRTNRRRTVSQQLAARREIERGREIKLARGALHQRPYP
jgi:hypothetical protein